MTTMSQNSEGEILLSTAVPPPKRTRVTPPGKKAEVDFGVSSSTPCLIERQTVMFGLE